MTPPRPTTEEGRPDIVCTAEQMDSALWYLHDHSGVAEPPLAVPLSDQEEPPARSDAAEWHRYLHAEGMLVEDEGEECGPWHHRVFLDRAASTPVPALPAWRYSEGNVTINADEWDAFLRRLSGDEGGAG